jgi:hypothetical protein
MVGILLTSLIWWDHPNLFNHPCGTQKIHFMRFIDICSSLHMSNIRRNSATSSLSKLYIVQLSI